MPRKAAIAALIAAGLVLAVAVAAAVDGVTGRHVALRPFAHPLLAGALAAVVLYFALRGLVPREHPRRLAQLGAGALALLLAIGAAWSWADGLRGPKDPSVVATGDDVQVVAWHLDVVGGQHLLLRLRSRDGLLSRDGTADLACVVKQADGLVNGWMFGSATVAGDRVVVRTSDGQEWPVGFDPATLRPTTPSADRCAAKP